MNPIRKMIKNMLVLKNVQKYFRMNKATFAMVVIVLLLGALLGALIGGCSGSERIDKKPAAKDQPAYLAAVSLNSSGDARLLSILIPPLNAESTTENEATPGQNEATPGTSDATASVPSTSPTAGRVTSTDISDSASLFVRMPDLDPLKAAGGSVGIADGNKFSVRRISDLKVAASINTDENIEFVTTCGAKTFLVGSEGSISTLEFDAAGKYELERTASIDISKDLITGAACYGKDRYLAIARSGTATVASAKTVVVLAVSDGKIFDRFDLKIPEHKLGQGPLLAGSTLKNNVYFVFNDFGNDRRNYVYLYDMLGHNVEKELSLNTRSKILFRPYFVSSENLMLAAADIATSDTIDPDSDEDEEKKNHVVFVDPEDLNLKKILELPSGFFSTKAVAMDNEFAYFAVDGQIFRTDLSSGKLSNFIDLPVELVTYLFL